WYGRRRHLVAPLFGDRDRCGRPRPSDDPRARQGECARQWAGGGDGGSERNVRDSGRRVRTSDARRNEDAILAITRAGHAARRLLRWSAGKWLCSIMSPTNDPALRGEQMPMFKVEAGRRCLALVLGIMLIGGPAGADDQEALI